MYSIKQYIYVRRWVTVFVFSVLLFVSFRLPVFDPFHPKAIAPDCFQAVPFCSVLRREEITTTEVSSLTFLLISLAVTYVIFKNSSVVIRFTGYTFRELYDPLLSSFRTGILHGKEF